MQEEVENRAVSLAVTMTKMTARSTVSMAVKVLKYLKNRHTLNRNGQLKKGKQKVKHLIRQNQGVSSMELEQSGMKQFDRIARKYGVDYAVRKEKGGEKAKYILFFKAKDADALTAAMKELTATMLKRKKNEKRSVSRQIQQYKERVRANGKQVRERLQEKIR